ncbi:PAS domain S-box-containing protein [Sphingobacterium nematocida]|uniref:histidine kinase n=1 Tax=Sphingobacterium nematocida TaxID=1513896 RepID=A0A1T5BAD3_9SPHI|nr:PAS domain-containing sensor histidine kinase [Sphingobacterium nematocida]SKB43940.1 PAS domain S-box-containing protein [Sphingobacterium nematocida]
MQSVQVTLGSTFFSSREGLLALDDSGVIIAHNEQALKLLDISAQNLENRKLSEVFVFYTIDTSLPLKINESPWEETIVKKVEKEDITLGIDPKNRARKWLSLSSKWMYNTEIPYVLVSFFDISKIVQQNIILAAKEQQINLLVSSLNDIVFEMTKEGDIINYWTNNDSLLFYPPSHFLGKNIKEILPDSMTTPALHLVQETLASGIEQEMDFLSPFESHKNCWYHLQVRTISKNTDRVAIIISDITKEIENTERIKLNENKFNQAFHFSGLGMSITGLDGYCLDANKVLCNMLGYTKKELQAVTFIDVTHPDDAQQDLELRGKLLNSEIDSFTFQKRYQHKTGHYVWCDTTVSLVRNHKHYPQFYIAQIQNISQAKLNIETLESQKAELESIKMDLETKVRQLEEFNQIVAHNLKGPVCNIQMLMEEIDTETDESRRKSYLSLLKCSGDNLHQALEELTNILELRGDISQSYKKCNFQDQLNKLYQRYLPEIKEKNAILTTDFKITHIHYPTLYLERILDNLLSNALRYTTIDRQPIIHINSYRKDDKTFLQITDNGIGIDLPKYKSQLFMFKKVFHRGFESKGMGLFTIRYLLENIGGKIDVESLPDKGSSFTIQF